MRELSRCLVMVLIILPLALLLIGPSLVLAALRGTQRVGQIVFTAGRSGLAGRVGTALLGLLLWAGVWGGLVVLARPAVEQITILQASGSPLFFPPEGGHRRVQGGSSSPTSANLPEPTATPLTPTTVTVIVTSHPPTVTATAVLPTTPTPQVVAVAQAATPTAFMPLTAEVPAASPTPPPTPPPPTPTPTLTLTPTSTPTLTPLPPSPTPTPTATPTLPPTPTWTATATPTAAPTPTPSPLPSPTPTPSPTPAPTPSATAPPSPTATIEISQATQAIAAVETANELLRLAVMDPSKEKLAALGQYWKEKAHAKAEAFAIGMYYKVGKPVEASYVYLIPPKISGELSQNLLFVDAIEVWTYKGSIMTYREQFEFFYTLTRQDSGWVIIDYVFRFAPSTAPPHKYG